MIEKEDDLFRKSNQPKEDPAKKKRKELFQTVNNLSRSRHSDLFEYIRNNEDAIRKANFSNEQLQTMRRSVSHSIGGSIEDIELVNRVFGPLVPSRPTASNSGTPCTPPAIKKRTPQEEIDYRANCTYETFYNWLMSDSTTAFLQKLTEDQRENLLYRLDEVIMMDYGLPKQRHYAEGDELVLRNRIQEMR